MSTTITLNHSQIMTRADAEISTLQKNREAAQARIQAIDADIATVDSRIQARNIHLSTLQQTVEHHQQAYDTALAAALLSDGTVSNKDNAHATKAAERALRDAQKAYSKAETKATSDDEQDTNHKRGLMEERALQEVKLASLGRMLATMQAAKEQQDKAIGEQEGFP